MLPGLSSPRVPVPQGETGTNLGDWLAYIGSDAPKVSQTVLRGPTDGGAASEWCDTTECAIL